MTSGSASRTISSISFSVRLATRVRQGHVPVTVLADAGANVAIADWNADRLENAVGSLADSALAAARTQPAADRSAPPVLLRKLDPAET